MFGVTWLTDIRSDGVQDLSQFSGYNVYPSHTCDASVYRLRPILLLSGLQCTLTLNFYGLWSVASFVLQVIVLVRLLCFASLGVGS